MSPIDELSQPKDYAGDDNGWTVLVYYAGEHPPKGETPSPPMFLWELSVGAVLLLVLTRRRITVSRRSPICAFVDEDAAVTINSEHTA